MVDISLDDEKYLIEDLEFIHYAVQKEAIKELKDNIDVLQDYTTLIKEAAALVDDIGIKDNSISKAYLIRKLIMMSVFSYNRFDRDNGDYYDRFLLKAGIEIVLGRGCCRHFSGITKDIMSSNGIFCENFCCINSKNRIKESLKFTGTHMISIIEYNGKCYGYDTYNDILLHFIDMNELQSDERGIFMYYKPLHVMQTEMLGLSDIKERLQRYYDSIGSHISIEELLEIKNETLRNIVEKRGKILDFSRSMMPVKKKIYTSLREVR